MLSRLALGYLRHNPLRTLLAVLNSGIEIAIILALVGVRYGMTSRPLEWPKGAVGVWVLVLLSFVLAVSFVFVTMGWYTEVTERAREIGILKALGASSTYILNWLFQETLFIAIPGTTIGIAITYGTKWLVTRAFSDFLTLEIAYKWWVTAGAISAICSLLGHSLPPGKRSS